MWTLYIDESGVPELSEDGKYVIIGGVLMEDSLESNYQFLIEKLKSRYNLELEKHIHATDIYESKRQPCYLGRTKKRTKRDLRASFQKDIWDLIKDYQINYFVAAVPKDLVKKSLKLNKRNDNGKSWINSSNFYARVDRQLPMDVGVNAIYHWAIKKIKNNDLLKIVFESRSGDMFTVRNFGYITSNGVFKNKHMVAFANRLKEHVVSVAFANKKVKSCGLELSDIISYTCNVYFLQTRKNMKKIDLDLKKAICFKGIHKTLNKKHYKELNKTDVRKYIPGITRRTQRISEKYRKLDIAFRRSLSPAMAGAQINK